MRPLTVIRILQVFFTLILATSYSYLSAQGGCPTNIDFKSGDFTNWECRYGVVLASSGQNVVMWDGTGQIIDRHQLIPPNNTEVDEFGGFPKHCPNTSSYTVKLGNNIAGHEAEGLFYTYTIPANNTKFSLLYNYAVVLQNPNHQPFEQPRFRARVVDVATGTEINCVSFDFQSSGALPGFLPTSAGGGVYKDWTPISVDLSAYAGKTIRLEFITSDCTFQQHFGYAYISMGSSCNGSISGNFYCQGDTTTTLYAPFGFQDYTWFSNPGFTQQIGNTQSLTLNISNAAVGSVLPVIVFPYPGYGCVDTLYATIGRAAKPVSVAGIDRTTCSKVPTQLGGPPNEDYEYIWDQFVFLNNAYIANPKTLPIVVTPTEFVVKTTDLATGCFSRDTVLVTPIVVDTASSFTGKDIYCPQESLQNTLSVTNTSTQVQWFRGNEEINSATSQTYRPTSVGTYWAEVKQLGCVDSTKNYTIRQAVIAKTAFTSNKEIQCLNQPINFLNTTTIANNEPVKYVWRFSDGTILQSTNAEKSFAAVGSYNATLIATTGLNCADSFQKTIRIVVSCDPILPTAFTPNKDGRNDRLTPFLAGAKGLKRFSIFNRYGNVVFTTTTEGEGWDGSYKGTVLSTAVFVWVIEYFDINDKMVTEKGTVTLIR